VWKNLFPPSTPVITINRRCLPVAHQPDVFIESACKKQRISIIFKKYAAALSISLSFLIGEVRGTMQKDRDIGLIFFLLRSPVHDMDQYCLERGRIPDNSRGRLITSAPQLYCNIRYFIIVCGDDDSVDQPAALCLSNDVRNQGLSPQGQPLFAGYSLRAPASRDDGDTLFTS